MARNKIRNEIKDLLALDNIEGTAYPNLWDTKKALLRGKLKAPSGFIKKLERFYTSNLTAHLRALEQKEAKTPKRIRWQKIIKLGIEINQVKTKRNIQRINKTQRWLFEKINMINESIAQLTKWHRNSIYIIKIKIERWDIIVKNEEIPKSSIPSTITHIEQNWKF